MIGRKVASLLVIGTAVLFLPGTAVVAGPTSKSQGNMSGNMQSDRFGGPVYSGAPSLGVTAALVKAGGGAQHFTIQKALVSMLGAKTVNAEVGKLQREYGKKNVTDWLNGFNFAVADGLKQATAAGVHLPQPPADLHGVKLAETLVDAGTAPDHVFWAGFLFDHALSHKIHYQVMDDIEAKDSVPYDLNMHRITNQAMYDVARALGKKNVKLASVH
jgi:hypothetical protein